MIAMHDGKCQPFTIDRLTGREKSPTPWGLWDDQLWDAQLPILGWRMDAFTYTEAEIINVGMFRPARHRETPFPAGTNILEPAFCLDSYKETPSAIVEGRFLDRPHYSPHVECSCGMRVVHDVRDIARYYYRHRNVYRQLFDNSTPENVTAGSAIFAVQGLGRTATATNFGHYEDPHGTLRTKYVGIEGIVLLDSPDAHVAPLFESLGFTAYIVPGLVDAHEAERCEDLYRVYIEEVDKKLHHLELNKDPGADGARYSTQSGELGMYGAAGVLLKTAAKIPRYLLQKRSDATFEPNTWTVPGGALHSRETPGQGAARELMEEAGISTLEGIRPIGVTELWSLNWCFTTIIGEVDEQLPAIPGPESRELRWLTGDQIRAMDSVGKLHPLFARTLDALLGPRQRAKK